VKTGAGEMKIKWLSVYSGGCKWCITAVT